MDKVYIIPQITLDSFKAKFSHDYTLTLEKNKIREGKVEAYNLIEQEAVSIDRSFFEANNIWLFSKEIFVTIHGSQEECKKLFQYFRQNEYKGEMGKLLQEAFFKVNVEDKAFKSYADTSLPTYTIEQFIEIDKYFKM